MYFLHLKNLYNIDSINIVWKNFWLVFTAALVFCVVLSVGFIVLPVRSQVVVQAYDWVRVGAFARYTSGLAPDGFLFPNGTKMVFYGSRLSSPAVLECTIIAETDTMVRLNVTFCINSTHLFTGKRIYHHVSFCWMWMSILETVFLTGEPIGKTCFWAVPLGEPDEEMVLYNMPSEQIGGYVGRVMTLDYNEEEVKIYRVDGIRHDPYYDTTSHFVWYTEMAYSVSFIGCYSRGNRGPLAHHLTEPDVNPSVQLN